MTTIPNPQTYAWASIAPGSINTMQGIDPALYYNPPTSQIDTWESVVEEYVLFLSTNGWNHGVSTVNTFTSSRGGLATQIKEQLKSLGGSAFSPMMVNAKAQKALTLPEVPIVDLPMKRRVTQPRFKLHYDTVKDFNLRLGNSIIHVGRLPYYVREIVQNKDDIILVVEDEKKSKGKITYQKNEAIDLRTPEPQYLMLDSYTVRLTRPPFRQQVQGLHSQNSFIQRVGKDNEGCYHWENPYELLWALKEGMNTITWDKETVNLMLKYRALKTLRLSGNVAAYRVGSDIFIEYKGRGLGELQDNWVRVDDLDMKQPWIKKDLQEVNLVMRGK